MEPEYFSKTAAQVKEAREGYGHDDAMELILSVCAVQLAGIHDALIVLGNVMMQIRDRLPESGQ